MNAPNFFLIDSNVFVVQAYAQFIHHDNWKFIPGNITNEELININSIDAFVSPANSKGVMDGGVDQGLLYYFGSHLQNLVQTQINDNHNGELPIGKALIVLTGDIRVPYLVVSPTMKRPEPIVDEHDVYYAAKALFKAIKHHNTTISKGRGLIKNVAMTGLGTGIGMLDPKMSAIHVARAYSFVF